MTTRRWLIAVAVVALVLFASVPPPAGRLHVENFSRVRNGMSQGEVEALLGGSPGNYGTPLAVAGWMTLEGYSGPPGSIVNVWRDDRNRLEIAFDDSGCVAGFHRRAAYSQVGPLKASMELLIDLIRRFTR
jgi:hypothetical protein